MLARQDSTFNEGDTKKIIRNSPYVRAMRTRLWLWVEIVNFDDFAIQIYNATKFPILDRLDSMRRARVAFERITCIVAVSSCPANMFTCTLTRLGLVCCGSRHSENHISKVRQWGVQAARIDFMCSRWNIVIWIVSTPFICKSYASTFFPHYLQSRTCNAAISAISSVPIRDTRQKNSLNAGNTFIHFCSTFFRFAFIRT